MAEGGDELRDRVDELEPALLEEGHERSADHRLGHRVHAVNRVLRKREGRLPVLPADLVGPHDLAPARHERADPAVAEPVHVRLHRRTDALQAAAAHADGLGFNNVRHAELLAGTRDRRPAASLEAGAEVRICHPDAGTERRINEESHHSTNCRGGWLWRAGSRGSPVRVRWRCAVVRRRRWRLACPRRSRESGRRAAAMRRRRSGRR